MISSLFIQPARVFFQHNTTMRYIKFITAIIIGALAFLALIAEIDTNNVILFFAIKIACLANIALSVKIIKDTDIIDIEE